MTMKDHGPVQLTSSTNPQVKEVVKLRRRSHRDELGLMIIEGYRELKRAIENEHFPGELFFCRELFQGENEDEIIRRCAESGARLLECTPDVFRKMAYRDRPEGLLGLAPCIHAGLDSLSVPDDALFVVAEAIEKPGNLGTLLRTSDAAGVHGVIVCDACTDINNPNVVRSSIGTLFAVPVAEATSEEAIRWLHGRNIRIVATTPHTETLHTQADLTQPSAIVVGTEQYGLSEAWLKESSVRVRIPMYGQADSLNVAAATTILLYEAVRQRRLGAA